MGYYGFTNFYAIVLLLAYAISSIPECFAKKHGKSQQKGKIIVFQVEKCL